MGCVEDLLPHRISMLSRNWSCFRQIFYHSWLALPVSELSRRHNCWATCHAHFTFSAPAHSHNILFSLLILVCLFCFLCDHGLFCSVLFSLFSLFFCWAFGSSALVSLELLLLLLSNEWCRFFSSLLVLNNSWEGTGKVTSFPLAICCPHSCNQWLRHRHLGFHIRANSSPN